MLNNKAFIRNNKVSFSIVLFLSLFSIVHFFKPPLIYDKQGAFREFGLGYKEKTVISMWVLSIILGILSYLVVSYYLMFG
jgi:hypothetical protein